MSISRRLFFALATLAASAASAAADPAYPTRHIRLIAPFTAGSTLDIMARLVAERLGAGLGHNVIVDNRPGANGIVGIDTVAKAPPDGHTMLITTGSFMGNIVLHKKLPYDGIRDFAPITQVARSYGLILVVHPGVPVQSVKELVALAKTRPGKISYGSSGSGNITHLVAELFNASAGTRIQHVPYKGAGPALTDVLGKQIEMTFVSTVFVQPFIKDGRVRPLALTGDERSPVTPDIPTFKEIGYPDVVMTGMYGLWFPAKTPQARVNRVHSEIRKAIAAPDMKTKLDELGLVGVGSTPAEFAKFIADDVALQTGIMKRAGIEKQ
ncbi:MAG TPA: tripartite tricarboxylate transporter substrate binding protein [Burkholderiales bacterium]|nr:tripartite tricarboxylate transporter substrate binding protein [Burkholderiales bacterium]